MYIVGVQAPMFLKKKGKGGFLFSFIFSYSVWICHTVFMHRYCFSTGAQTHFSKEETTCICACVCVWEHMHRYCFSTGAQAYFNKEETKCTCICACVCVWEHVHRYCFSTGIQAHLSKEETTCICACVCVCENTWVGIVSLLEHRPTSARKRQSVYVHQCVCDHIRTHERGPSTYVAQLLYY